MSSNLRIAAIVAVADGRYADAVDILDALTEARPVVSGACRYCGCRESNACTIVVQPEPQFPPALVTCSWVDRDQTVCSNRRCLDQWLSNTEDAPEGAERSGIVLP